MIKTLRVFGRLKAVIYHEAPNNKPIQHSIISGDSLGSWRRRHILLLSGFIDRNGSVRSLLLDYHDH